MRRKKEAIMLEAFSIDKELKQSDILYKHLIELTPEAIVVHIDGKLLYANKAALDFIGVKDFTEIFGEDIMKFVHPDSRKIIQQFVKMVGKKRKITDVVEEQFISIKGDVRTAEVKAIPFIFRGKNVILVILRDVTTQRKVEEIQSRLAAIVSSSDDAIISKTLKGVITSWNKSAEKLFGYTEKEAVGQHISFIIPNDLRKEEDEIIKRLKKGYRIDHFETKRVTKSGEHIYLSLSISPIRNEKAEIIGASKIARNVTEKKKSEERQRLLEKISKKLTMSLDNKIVLQDITDLFVETMADYSRIVVADENKEIQEIAVTHRDPSKIQMVKELYNNYISYAPMTYGVGKLIETGIPELISIVDERILTNLNGNKKLKNLLQAIGLKSYIGVPLIVKGRILGALILSSVTEGRYYTKDDLHFVEEVAYRIAMVLENTRLYELAVKELHERERIEKQKDEFISIATHELKTPVTSIKAYAQALERRFRKNNEMESANHLSKMDAQVDKLTNLISDLLDVTKIQSGHLQFQVARFDVDELISEIVEELQRTTEKHTIIIDSRVKKKIYGDRDRIGQVLNNLISNAIKYSPHANKIIVREVVEKDTLTISVQDYGLGIPIDKQDKVFDRFYRISGPKGETFPGLGLGLYISSEIIKRQGGKIWVKSIQGKGSTFFFQLPFKKTILQQPSGTIVVL